MIKKTIIVMEFLMKLNESLIIHHEIMILSEE